MRLTVLILLPVILLHTSQGYEVAPSNMAALASNSYVRGCYYTNWAQYRQGKGKFMPEDITKGLCTHILYAFAKIDENGTSLAFEWNDEDTDGSEGMYSRVVKLKQSDPGLKVLLSYGGYNFGSDIFTKVAQSADKRKNFIDSAISFLRKNKFDGFDLDWEYPAGVAKDHATLVKETRAGFENEAKTSGQERLLLTAAVAAGKDKIDDGYDVPSIASDLDLIFLMSYDFHGSWDANVDLHAKLNPTTNETVGKGIYNTAYAASYWAEKGMPKEKIIIGIPTYGQGWTLSDPSQTVIGAAAKGKAAPSTTNPDGGTASYWEMCDYLKDGGKETVDSEGVGAYMVKGDQWYGYDTPDTVKTKMEWLKKEGYGGAFIWCLDFDDFKGESCGKGAYPLMNSINEGLGGGSPSAAASGTTAGAETTTAGGAETTTAGDSITTQPSSGGESTAKPDDTTAGGQADVTGDSEATTKPGGDSKCPKPDGLFADPSDCSKYYNCAGGTPNEATCPTGTYFDEKVGNCDHIDNAPPECKKS